jgi:catechol-2,3-dioxygenase
MPNVTKLSHAVLFISNLERSRPFYEKAFGLQFVAGRPGAAFFRIPGGEDHHNLALMEVGAGAPVPQQGSVGLYHLAWEVESIDALAAAIEPLVEMGALVGASDHGATKSLYGKDPDGIEFEVARVLPKDLLDDDALEARKTIAHLDLAKEKARYGADTQGGVGISR